MSSEHEEYHSRKIHMDQFLPFFLTMSFTNAEAEDAFLAETANWLCGAFPDEFRVSPQEQVLKYCSPNTVAAAYVDSHANKVANWVYDGLGEMIFISSAATPSPTGSPPGKSPYFNLWMQRVHSSHWFVICARIWV